MNHFRPANNNSIHADEAAQQLRLFQAKKLTVQGDLEDPDENLGFLKIRHLRRSGSQRVKRFRA